VRHELEQAGFSKIEFLESAYVVRATNSSGKKLVITITPQEVRAVELTPSRWNDNSGTGSKKSEPTPKQAGMPSGSDQSGANSPAAPTVNTMSNPNALESKEPAIK
jgi:hypothetical protein